MKVEIYVQARMGSKRLPGKVLKPVLGKPLLSFLVERLRNIKEADAFAILTTHSPADDAIVSFCEEKSIPCYRGPEDDVLTRYHQVALDRRPDVIVRVTADCPLIDPKLADQVIKDFRDNYPTYDYISTTGYPRGLDLEVLTFEALDRAFKEGMKPEEREHVTPFIYRHPEIFQLKMIASPKPLGEHRWTVDTIEDFNLVKILLENLYPLNPDFSYQDILNLLKQHPEWIQINAHVKQKLLS